MKRRELLKLALGIITCPITALEAVAKAGVSDDGHLQQLLVTTNPGFRQFTEFEVRLKDFYTPAIADLMSERDPIYNLIEKGPFKTLPISTWRTK